MDDNVVTIDRTITCCIAWSRDQSQCTHHQVFADQFVSASACKHIMHLGKGRNEHVCVCVCVRACVFHSKAQLHNINVQAKLEALLLHLHHGLFCSVTAKGRGQRANRSSHQRTSGLNTVPFSLLLQWLQRCCMTSLSASVS